MNYGMLELTHITQQYKYAYVTCKFVCWRYCSAISNLLLVASYCFELYINHRSVQNYILIALNNTSGSCFELTPKDLCLHMQMHKEHP